MVNVYKYIYSSHTCTPHSHEYVDKYMQGSCIGDVFEAVNGFWLVFTYT